MKIRRGELPYYGHNEPWDTISVMKKLISVIFILFQFIAAEAATYSSDIEELLCRLDSMIDNEGRYVQDKMSRISTIRNTKPAPRTDEEKYWHNRSLYDEYYVFNADSAIKYSMENLALSQKLGNKQWEYEWRINKSFSLSVMGLLSDALKELSYVNPAELSNLNKIKYYGQLAYMYSHMGQLSDHRIIDGEDYDHLSHVYEDSITSVLTKDSPDYIWYTASSQIDRAELPDYLLQMVKSAVDSCNFNSRSDAMNCYILSRIYERLGDNVNRMRYLILSGMTDIKIANRDIASLNELSDMLLKEGDIERAYKYVNYSLNQALLLPNRIRGVALSKTMAEVHQLYEKKLKKTQRDLFTVTVVLLVIVIFLVFMMIMYRRRSMQLKKSQNELKQANQTLTENMEKITVDKTEREQLINDLMKSDSRNKAISNALKEANYLKEECLGATFALCSNLIDRSDEYRKKLYKLVKDKKWKELESNVVADEYSNRELKYFYSCFDVIFLNIFPNFVEDMNSLLRPEEQIELPEGELNTELRIYALIRLGISNSVKIAELLHCSPQTVYNYRLRMRNKAKISKNNFADTVSSLGKIDC